jgi:hypothetical protein
MSFFSKKAWHYIVAYLRLLVLYCAAVFALEVVMQISTSATLVWAERICVGGFLVITSWFAWRFYVGYYRDFDFWLEG